MTKTKENKNQKKKTKPQLINYKPKKVLTYWLRGDWNNKINHKLMI